MMYHLVRKFIENDLIKLEFIRIEEQLGDILIKPFDRVKFYELHAKDRYLRHKKTLEEIIRS
jgi:hypothetical protein